jgi:hypothetical protein
MSNQEKNKEDYLRQYINPERIEKAPEGFTSNIMTRIQVETELVKGRDKLRTRSIVPVISVTIIFLLIIAAFILPSGGNDTALLPGTKYFQNINLPVIKINLESLFSHDLPAWSPYLFIGILILTILDKALYGLFHRKEE